MYISETRISLKWYFYEFVFEILENNNTTIPGKCVVQILGYHDRYEINNIVRLYINVHVYMYVYVYIYIYMYPLIL